MKVDLIQLKVDLNPLEKAAEPLWKQFKTLFAEHHFITIVCAFFVLMLTLSCYRFLKSISPALVALICLLVVGILIMHWTATRTEPPFMTPFIEFLAPFFPSAVPAPAKP
jgi:hypothetical protein